MKHAVMEFTFSIIYFNGVMNYITITYKNNLDLDLYYVFTGT